MVDHPEIATGLLPEYPREMDQITIPILILSILLQLAAAVYAVLLANRARGTGLAWLFIATALFLLCGRCAVQLLGLLVPTLGISMQGTLVELVALFIALLMAVGVFQMPHILNAQDEENKNLALSEEAHQATARRLETNLQHLKHALNHLPGLLLATDSKGVIKTIHGQGRSVLGPAANWAVGRSVTEVYSYAPWLREGLERALLGETTVAVGKYGSALYQVGMAPMGEGTTWRGGIVLVAAPVVEGAMEKPAVQQAAPSPDPSLEARRLNQHFMVLAAQELAPPMAALGQAVQELQDGGPAHASPAATHKLDLRLRKLAQRLDDLFGVGQPAPSKPTPAQASGVTDLSLILHRLIGRLSPEAARQRTPLHLEAPLPVIGPWSSREMEELLLRLISDAVTAGAGRPVELELTLRDEVARLVVRLYGQSEAANEQFSAGLDLLTQSLASVGGAAYLRGGQPVGLDLTVYLPIAPASAQISLPSGPEGVT